MNGNATRFIGCSAGLVGLVTLAWALAGQAAKPAQHGIPLPTDWSHHHLIFSQPGTPQQLVQVESDPRYWQQLQRSKIRLAQPERATENFVLNVAGLRSAAKPTREVHPDWSQNLGNRGTPTGAGIFPAKISFNLTTAKCANTPSPDFVVFSTGLLGSGTQASIVAFDNLYSGCPTGTVPSVYWAYNTGGQILTSPVPSRDGSQIAFVQTDGASHGILVVLKWKPSATDTVSSPGVPTSVLPVAYPTCVAPCMTTIDLRSGLGTQTDDTTSSAFYDYTGDIAWVGDSQSWLHRFIQVFGGVPTEVRTAPWPLHVNPGNPTALSGPVFDHISGNIFLGDAGGFFYRVSKASGAVTKSRQVDHGTGIVSGPVVDSTAGKVYVFSSNDGSAACVGATPCAAVFQFGTNFAAGTAGTKAIVGASTSPNPNPLYEGALDGTYENSINATGNLYVCGNTGGPPILFRIPIAAGAMGAPVAGPVLANATTGCSPVTDVPNPNVGIGGTEWIFASVQNSGLPTSCAAGGCITNFEETPWKASTAYVVGQQVIDTHFQIQTVRVAGTSKAGAHPAWSVVSGATTADNTVRWLNQGPVAASYAVWQASQAYPLNQRIIDSNQNIQLVTTAGTSKAGAHPVWNVNVNGATIDNTVS